MVNREIQVKEYTNADYENCCSIYASNIPKFFLEHEFDEFKNYLKNYVQDDYWVVLKSGELVASGGIHIKNDGSASLCYGIVRNDLHRQGIGRFLINYRLKKIIENDAIKIIRFDTSQHNPGFFNKFGFETQNIEKDGYGESLDSYEMSLTLPEKGSLERKQILENIEKSLKI